MFKLFISGTVSGDAKVAKVGDSSVVNFSVRWTELFVNRDGKQQSETYWIGCSLWTEQVSVINDLRDGSAVIVEGTPKAKLLHKQDGSQIAVLNVRVNSLHLINPRDGSVDYKVKSDGLPSTISN